jgi:hypothetical protein
MFDAAGPRRSPDPGSHQMQGKRASQGDTMAMDTTERYRQAAEDALQQLDWCIGYLHGIRKSNISTQLAKNRSYIKRNLMHEAGEPVPTEVTDEA